MIVMVSTKTLSAREPDHSASTKPTEITSNRPPSSTSSMVGRMIVLTAPLGEGLRRQVDHRLPHVVELGGAEAVGHVADRPGQREDQRRHREDREERRLGGQPGHPVAHARADRRDDEPPQVLAHRHAPRPKGPQRRMLLPTATMGLRYPPCRPDLRDATNQAPPLVGHNVVTSDLALAEAVTRHASADVLDDLAAARRRGRHRRGPRARDARQPAPPRAGPLRPLRQPGRRGRLPPLLALADGAGGRPRARGRAVGRPTTPARARAPRGRLPGLVADRARATAARSR